MQKRIDRNVRRTEVLPMTLGAHAVQLLHWARQAGGRGLLRITAGEDRAEALARALRGLDPDLDVVVFPPWDCLPYDRASPSREAMGRRAAALARLAREASGPRIVLAPVDAAVQRVPPRGTWDEANAAFEVGGALDLDALGPFLERIGYRLDERVDEPGEAAIRGGVVDLYPADAGAPRRIEHEDGRIVGIRAYDPVSQRTTDEVEALTLWPASEVILPEGEGPPERFPGMEHWLPDHYPQLDTLFDYLPDAVVALGPGVEDRRAALDEQIADA